ncbi:MAG: hypothetical protein ACRDZQ_01225 [Acidimicrobiales bacterium]
MGDGSTYRVERLLWRLRHDAALAERYRSDPQTVMVEHGLDDEERGALGSGDFRSLYAAGVNPYILYFGALEMGVPRASYYEALRAEGPEAE